MGDMGVVGAGRDGTGSVVWDSKSGFSSQYFNSPSLITSSPLNVVSTKFSLGSRDSFPSRLWSDGFLKE